MPEFKIKADPDSEVGLAVGAGFIAFEGVHDVARAVITKKRRFIINMKEDDMLWLVEALAKELPHVLRDEAVSRINDIATSTACKNCEFEPAEEGSEFCEICG